MKREERLKGSAVPENAREVELPVCPHCGNVSKQPGMGSKTSCMGPRGAGHKKTTMVLVKYRAV